MNEAMTDVGERVASLLTEYFGFDHWWEALDVPTRQQIISELTVLCQDHVILALMKDAELSREASRLRVMEHPDSFALSLEFSAWATLRNWLKDRLIDPESLGTRRSTEV